MGIRLRHWVGALFLSISAHSLAIYFLLPANANLPRAGVAEISIAESDLFEHVAAARVASPLSPNAARKTAVRAQKPEPRQALIAAKAGTPASKRLAPPPVVNADHVVAEPAKSASPVKPIAGTVRASGQPMKIASIRVNSVSVNNGTAIPALPATAKALQSGGKADSPAIERLAGRKRRAAGKGKSTPASAVNVSSALAPSSGSRPGKVRPNSSAASGLAATSAKAADALKMPVVGSVKTAQTVSDRKASKSIAPAKIVAALRPNGIRPAGPAKRQPVEDLLDPVDAMNQFVVEFDGGPCFFATPVETSRQTAFVEGIGVDLKPFQTMHDAFKEVHGFEPDIGLRLISKAQCAIVELLNDIRSMTGVRRRIELEFDVLADREYLSGSVAGFNGAGVVLLIIDDEGTVFKIDTAMPLGSTKLDFKIQIFDLDLGGDPRPILLLAIASNKTISFSGQIRSAEDLLRAFRQSVDEGQTVSNFGVRYIAFGGR